MKIMRNSIFVTMIQFSCLVTPAFHSGFFLKKKPHFLGLKKSICIPKML
jgi:hypothetical protein